MGLAAAIVAKSLIVLGGLLGVLLTLMTLPGTWITIIIAIGCQIWQENLFSWWTLGAAIGLAVIAELLELFASAAGASKLGGSKKAGIAAIIGSILGAVVGSGILFVPIGTIVGAVVGAGLAAALAERGAVGKTWSASAKVGAGAAAGRFAATVSKAIFASLIALILSIAAFVP